MPNVCPWRPAGLHRVTSGSCGINAKNAFFSANERSKGVGKGKEEEGKGGREREIESEALAETEKVPTALAGN